MTIQSASMGSTTHTTMRDHLAPYCVVRRSSRFFWNVKIGKGLKIVRDKSHGKYRSQLKHNQPHEACCSCLSQNGKFILSRKEDNESFTLLDTNSPAQLPTGQKVQDAINTVNASEVSLFSRAILSGKTDSVELIHDLVVGIFGDNKNTVRRMKAVSIGFQRVV